jgi:hypothetical protein
VTAAFLLAAAAWAPGADAAPAPLTTPGAPLAPIAAPAASAPAGVHGAPISVPYSAGCGSGGSGGCGGGGDCGCASDCGCESKPSFFERIKGRFHRSSCGDNCDSCSSCGSSRGHGHAAASCECGCEAKPSWKDRLKGRFHKSSDCGCDSGCDSGCGGSGGAYAAPIATGGHPVILNPGSMPPAGEPIKAPKDAKDGKDGAPGDKLPTGGKTQAAPVFPEVTPTSASKTNETETKNPFELDRRYEVRVDRAADYSWVTGQLFYVHADGGLWVLRYAPLSKEDPYGGSVVLARDRQMDSYREGDLVTVHGEIINEKGSAFLGGAQYRARTIQLVDRAGR